MRVSINKIKLISALLKMYIGNFTNTYPFYRRIDISKKTSGVVYILLIKRNLLNKNNEPFKLHINYCVYCSYSDCNTDHYLAVAKLRERISVSK